MLRKRLFCALAAAMLLSACSVTPERPPEREREYVTLTMPWIITTGKISNDFGLINEKLSELTREKIGVNVEILPVSFYANARDEILILKKQGKILDISFQKSEKNIPLDGLLPEYGDAILRALNEEQLSWGRVDGVQYYLPTCEDNTNSAGVAMRKDILEKHGIDISGVDSIEEVDEILELVHKYEPEMSMIMPLRANTTFFNRFFPWVSVNGSSFAYLDEDTDEIKSIFDTDEYHRYVTMFRKWHNRGYLPQEIMLQNIGAERYAATGRLFSFVCAAKPGIESELYISSGYRMEVMPIKKPIVIQTTATKMMWGVTAQSRHPVESIKLLNLLYGDAEIMNLLTYGIEGRHYIVTSDNTADYPGGVTPENSDYTPNVAWFAPNQALALLWDGYPKDLWEMTARFDSEARRSPLFSFNFDSSAVKDESRKVSEVILKYNQGFGTGYLDVEELLPKLIGEMKEAGVDKVLDQMNTQYKKWKRE